jgi:hypothetical protein
MKVLIIHWSSQLLLDHRHNGAMVKMSNDVTLCRLRALHMLMEWDVYGNCAPPPACIIILPTLFLFIEVGRPRVLLLADQHACRISSGLKPGAPIISTSSLKLFCDFCAPLFQYQSPRRKQLSFRYGLKFLSRPPMGALPAGADSQRSCSERQSSGLWSGGSVE